MRKDTPVYDYQLFGLRLRSRLLLPELNRWTGEDLDGIAVRYGAIPAVPGGEATHWLTQTSEGAVLSVANIGRFCIRDGREIIVDPDPAASDRNVRLYLLGSAMGALLHQRRMLPLHANAVVLANAAVAFLGASGAGKSTLAAAFHDHGCPVLSDDVCVVSEMRQGYSAEPGIPRVRLWRDAVERSGRTVHGYERAFDSLDKYTVGLVQGDGQSATPLRAIYVLTTREEEGVAIRRLDGVAAAKALIENTYRGSFVSIVGDPQGHFEKCLTLSKKVPIFGLARQWDAARIPYTIAKVNEHLDTMGPIEP